MPIKRTRFPLSDTGTFGDTGFINGELHQLRWYRSAYDTGHDLTVAIHPSEGDTGHGFQVWTSDSGQQQASYLVHPRAKGFDAALGQDTGPGFPYAGAGDKLRVKITAKGTGTVSGTLYVYTKD